MCCSPPEAAARFQNLGALIPTAVGNYYIATRDFRLSIATNTKHMPVNIATSRTWNVDFGMRTEEGLAALLFALPTLGAFREAPNRGRPIVGRFSTVAR